MLAAAQDSSQAAFSALDRRRESLLPAKLGPLRLGAVRSGSMKRS